MGAERLPVTLVPEQGTVATVRLDMIDHDGRLAAHGAIGMLVQECAAGLAPAAVIAAIIGVGPALVRLSAALVLAHTAGIASDDATACTDTTTFVGH